MRANTLKYKSASEPSSWKTVGLSSLFLTQASFRQLPHPTRNFHATAATEGVNPLTYNLWPKVWPFPKRGKTAQRGRMGARSNVAGGSGLAGAGHKVDV